MSILVAWTKAKMASRKNQKGVVFIEYLALATAIIAGAFTVSLTTYYGAIGSAFADLATSI